MHVASLPSLAAAYPDAEGLGMVAYLRMPAFRGRQLLAMTRLNVLPLGAAEAGARTTVCSICMMPEQDARTHFLFECPPLQAVRDVHAHIPPLQHNCVLAPPHRTSWLIHSARDHPKVPATVQQITYARSVGAFLHDMFHARQRLTGRPADPSLMPRS